MDLDSDASVTRRRGPELEAALLDAAWDELEANGYARFTFDAVAERARTSRSVIYRRWQDRESLVISAIRRHFDRDFVETPDTGSLRGDMIARLRGVSERRAGIAVMIGAQLSGMFGPDGITLSDARDRLLGGAGNGSDIVLERAQQRGEIDLDRLPESVRSVPFDLLQQKLLLTLQPVPDEYIITIVDEIFLPLIQHYRAG
ncbi:MAG: TetR/AcrR family transcriptional regulator [Actinobacteria bacterium]|nr:TetR/AcrR family transcriptional regulator [Actinomycetota bacterium]